MTMGCPRCSAYGLSKHSNACATNTGVRVIRTIVSVYESSKLQQQAKYSADSARAPQ